jgi:hypothetical protein
MQVLYDTAAQSPAGAILDANWRPEVDCRRLEQRSVPLVQVFCDVAPAIAHQRLVERVKSGSRPGVD